MIKKIIRKLIPGKIIDFGFDAITHLYILYYTFVFKGLVVRRGTTDRKVFRKIFINREYDLALPLNPKLIIDAGANAGYASLFFSRKYAKAKIIAIEPEESNFETLKKNTKRVKNIEIFKKGLWSHKAYLKIIDTGSGKWGFAVKETGAGEKFDVDAITVDDILSRAGCDRIDILKIDIEGAEKELFSKNCKSWINKTNMIIIELHDRFETGCSDAFYSAIAGCGFKKMEKGENIIVFREAS